MTRWRALGVLGLVLAASAGIYAGAGDDSPGSVGPGRYRDGRGREGREGPSDTAVAASPSPLLTGLLAYWPLQTNSTDSLGLHNGTDTRVTYSSGAGFLTNNGSIAVTSFSTTATFTISVWVKPVSPVGYTDGFGQIAGPAGGTNALYMNNARPKFFPLTSATGSLTAGAWAHLAVVADGAKLTYYLNGVADATTPSFSSATTIALLGATSAGGSECIGGTAGTGMIKEVGVWSVALSSGNITTLFNSGTPKTYPF